MKWFIVLSIYAASSETTEIYTSKVPHATAEECVRYLHTDKAMTSIKALSDYLDGKFGKGNYTTNLECLEEEVD